MRVIRVCAVGLALHKAVACAVSIRRCSRRPRRRALDPGGPQLPRVRGHLQPPDASPRGLAPRGRRPTPSTADAAALHHTRAQADELADAAKGVADKTIWRQLVSSLADLLEKMFALEPDKRIDVDSAMRHPFVKSFLPKRHEPKAGGPAKGREGSVPP